MIEDHNAYKNPVIEVEVVKTPAGTACHEESETAGTEVNSPINKH
ncbi:hypothetical protein AB1K84_07235 [Mesobacillus foraminis]